MLTVEPVTPSKITPGSVAVYRRFNRLLAHRVVRIDADESGAPVFVLRGDSATDYDAPVPASEMLGEVVKVERRTSAVRLHAGTSLRRFLRSGLMPAVTVRATRDIWHSHVRRLAFASAAAVSVFLRAS